MAIEELAATPLPEGYSSEALYLRRWVLDLQLHLAALPLERQRMLERKIYGFHFHGKKVAGANSPGTSRASNAHLLAHAVG
jgi:hypothetical protein